MKSPWLPSIEVEADDNEVEEEEVEGLQLQRIEPVTLMNTHHSEHSHNSQRTAARYHVVVMVLPLQHENFT